MAATYTHTLKRYTDVQAIVTTLQANQFTKDGSAHQRVTGKKKLTINWGRDGNPNQLTQRVNQLTFRLAHFSEAEAAEFLNALF